MDSTTAEALAAYQQNTWVEYPNTGYWPTTTIYTTAPVTECSGDVHVFPCPHCDKCKCGAATVKRKKK